MVANAGGRGREKPVAAAPFGRLIDLSCRGPRRAARSGLAERSGVSFLWLAYHPPSPPRMFIFFRQSLRGRLLVLVSLVAGALCLLAGLLTWRAYDNVRDAVFHELGGTARASAALVDQRVETMDALLRGLLTAGELEVGNFGEFHARAAQMTEPGRRWIVVTDLDGQQVINTHLPFGSTLPRVTQPTDHARFVAEGRNYVSNLTPGPASGKQVLYVTSEVAADDGRKYRVSIAFTPEEFSEGLATITPPGHILGVVDRNGIIAMRSRSPEKFIGKPASDDVRAAMKRGGETLLYSRTMEGDPVLAALVPAPRTGWSVIVGAPRAQLQASARRLAILGLLTSFAILAVATAVAWWIVRAAVHDMSALVVDTRAIAAGAVPGESQTKLTETRLIAAALRTTAEQLSRESEERRQVQAQVIATKEALARANMELEKKVTERTASLAELVNQMEEFTYSISHDLRSPVRAMTSFAQIALEDYSEQIGPDAKPLITRVIASGERMDRLINDLLAFSRVSRNDLELLPVDLDALTRACVREHPVLGSLAASITIEGVLPRVLGHAPALDQVITNLLSNAVKFVAPGETPKVRVYAERRPDAWRLWVCDQGIGIPPQFHGKLFNVFGRVHAGSAYEGSGIGLAIVRRAVDRMGGHVGVESDGATGTRFWVELKPALR